MLLGVQIAGGLIADKRDIVLLKYDLLTVDFAKQILLDLYQDRRLQFLLMRNYVLKHPL